MSYTIFTSNPAALIAQPGRAVNTFPSGLVRVDQTYLGLTSQAATHRATLEVGNDMPDGDSSPCIDGLKIFPEVQERRREDGFTEFIVSAYGRVDREQVIYTWDVFSESQETTQGDGTITNTGVYKQNVKTVKRVVLASEEYNFASDLTGVNRPQLIIGHPVVNIGIYMPGVLSYAADQYGYFKEITVVIKAFKVSGVEVA